MAMVMAAALGKRAAGSLAILRRMTNVRAGGIFGLIRTGEVAVALTCCIRMAAAFSPWKGSTPVQIS